MTGMTQSIRAALSALTIAALATGGAARAADEAKGKKIFVAQAFAAHPYIAALSKSFKERAEQLGMDVTMQAGGLDAALQSRQIDDAIARKVDMLVIMPISEQAVVPSLARAKEAKIPVVILNNPPREGTQDMYLTYVGQDQKEMGAIGGRAIVKALKDSGRTAGKIALITGALQGGIGPRRLDGMKATLASDAKFEIAATEDGRWDTATSERIAGQLFAKFAATGGLDAIYGMADNQALAAIRAADAAGIKVGGGAKDLVVIGGNCLKEGIDAIKAGKLQASVTQIPTDLGRKGAEVVADIFAGKPVPKEVQLPIEIIDKANVTKWEAACTY